jgi:hypothetical protein
MLTIQPLAGSPSPQYEGYWRESAEIYFASWSSPKTLWIDVPMDKQSTVASNANHWLICCYLLAYELQTDIHISGKIDQLLAKNLHSINVVFNNWFKTNHCVQISALETLRLQRNTPQRRGLFFSGGVDSMFSLFDAEQAGPESSIAELLCVWGFDVPLSEPIVFSKLQGTLEKVARSLGKVFTPVITNLRTLGEPYQHQWGSKGHGAALAAMAHMLSPTFTEVRIASSFDYGNLLPWGSHPLTDPLYSASNLAISHDGAAWTRVEKTALLAQSDLALLSIHVCTKTDSAHNCSRCSKCTRTMLTLDILGAMGRANSFDWSDYSVKKLEPVLLSNWLDRAFFHDIRRIAQEQKRTDIEQYIARSRRYSRWMRPIPGRFIKSPLGLGYSNLIKSLLT